MACAVNSPDQQRTTCRRTCSAPRTHRKVSCWPAKEVVSESSPTALERTATGTSAPRAAYAASISAATPAVSSASVNRARASAEAAAWALGVSASATSLASRSRRSGPTQAR
jgi:hypothetical protein